MQLNHPPIQQPPLFSPHPPHPRKSHSKLQSSTPLESETLLRIRAGPRKRGGTRGPKSGLSKAPRPQSDRADRRRQVGARGGNAVPCSYFEFSCPGCDVDGTGGALSPSEDSITMDRTWGWRGRDSRLDLGSVRTQGIGHTHDASNSPKTSIDRGNYSLCSCG